MSFYYISQELADALDLSTEYAYDITTLEESFRSFFDNSVKVGRKYERMDHKHNYMMYYKGNKEVNLLVSKEGKNLYQSWKTEVGQYYLDKYDCFCTCCIKTWLEDSKHLIVVDMKEEILNLQIKNRELNQKLKEKISINYKYEKQIEILEDANKNNTEDIKRLEDENRGLKEVEINILELFKNTNKLETRLSALEEENKKLKENFKTSVLEIVKEYVYNLLPSFLKK
jgi:hypothetical protein